MPDGARQCVLVKTETTARWYGHKLEPEIGQGNNGAWPQKNAITCQR